MARRQFLRATGAGVLGLAAPGLARARPAERVSLYLGTYTRGGSKGIYLARFHPGSGALTLEGAVAEMQNPSFLAVDTRGRHLYAVSETGETDGQPGGSVVAFAIEQGGGLRRLNRQLSHGGAPCHLVVDAAGRNVLVANYSGGNVAVLPIRADGALEPASAVVQHHGSSVNPSRQREPHAHSVNLDAANRHAFVADLGIDRVVAYRFDPAAGALAPEGVEGAVLRPGAGPRHFAWHPDGRRAYVINELDSTVTAFGYRPETGALRAVQTVSTLPAGYEGRNSCADIHVDAAGRYLYGSNRGHDSIAVFAIQPDTGELSLVQHQPTLGRTPRNFGIDPTGRFLLAANQDTGNVVVFAIHPQRGTLQPTGALAEIPYPVCVRFAPPRG